jgi:hypothetical protein
MVNSGELFVYFFFVKDMLLCLKYSDKLLNCVCNQSNTTILCYWLLVVL